MIIVVEGPTAAGKTTWIAAHGQHAAIIGETRPGPAPDRSLEPAAAAGYWAQADAARWAAARQAEHHGRLAVCDTDPFKLHYIWCLWRTGNAATSQWRAQMRAHRALFARHQLGIADLILIAIPDPATLAARRQADTTRRRRHFGLHARLAGPLRDWYDTIGRLDPSRVRWELPRAGIPVLGALGPRNPRTGTDIYDALIDQLPAR